MQLLLPMLQIACICNCIKDEMSVHLDLACAYGDHNAAGGSNQNYSKILLDHITNNSGVSLTYYANEQLAIDSVRNGYQLAAILVPENFSSHLELRLQNPFMASTEIVQGATISVYSDTNRVPFGIKFHIFHCFMHAQIAFLKSLPKMLDYPFSLDKMAPIIDFAIEYQTIGKYVIPGLLLLAPFFLAASTAILLYVHDIGSGVLQRMLITNVKRYQIQCAFLIVQLAVIMLQALILIVVMSYVFQYDVLGRFWLVFVFITLQGLIGITYGKKVKKSKKFTNAKSTFLGFFISSLNDDIFTVSLSMSGSLLPILVLSGTLWPAEAMSRVMQWVGMLMPQTYAAKALRLVTSAGVGIENSIVQTGLIASMFFFLLFFVLSLTVVKLRK